MPRRTSRHRPSLSQRSPVRNAGRANTSETCGAMLFPFHGKNDLPVASISPEVDRVPSMEIRGGKRANFPFRIGYSIYIKL